MTTVRPAEIEPPIPLPPPWWSATRSAPAAVVRHPLLGDPDPVRDRGVICKGLEHRVVDRADVAWIAGEGDPTAGTAAYAEVRPDEERDEALEGERSRRPRSRRLLSDRVAV